ncbi:MAG: alpha/beta hydrolase [Phycisphaerae bacterium]|nr:alpha/beta hydrolase [Phycisphaerae bacterium]
MPHLRTFLYPILMAAMMIASLQCTQEKPMNQPNGPRTQVTASAAVTQQFGAKRLDFPVPASNGGYAILPAKTRASGRHPWIYYAPSFIGQLPAAEHEWYFTQLLDAGFAICGVDVGESFGSPAGRAAYTELWRIVTTELRLDRQACLLPQSRGGLMLYNWAAENPDKVRCVGGIYTVCNLRSYPGLDNACGAYGLTAAQLESQLAEHNPIDRLAPLAAAGIPILHLHGDMDTVVPLEHNSAELIRRYQALSGPGELIVVPSKGHEVCPEFFHRPELVEFFVRCGG